MRILKDNYFERVNQIQRRVASPLAVMCSLLILMAILLAVMSAPAQIIPMAALMGALTLAFYILRSVDNQIGAVGDVAHLEGVAKYPTKDQLVYLGQALNIGGMTPLGGAVPFPFGDGYDMMMIDIYISITQGSMSGAISEGELLFIKNIYLKTDKHGAIIDNVCGRSLFYRAQKITGTLPYKDAIAATTAVYVVSIPVHFANPRMRRPQDTLLDMAGVKSLDLQVTLGGLSDMFTTTTGGAVSVTCDISVKKTIGPVDAGTTPVMQPYLCPLNPWDPSVQQNIELPKTSDLGILDIMLFTSNSATSGVPWSGTPTANVLKRITFEDNVRKIVDQMTVTQIKNQNKVAFQYETIKTGLFILDLVREDSVWQAYSVGGKAKVNVNWINDTLSTSQVSGLLDGVVSLKAAA